MKSWSIVFANTAVVDLGCPWIGAEVKTILTQKCLFILKLGVNGRDVWYFVEHKDLLKRFSSKIFDHNSPPQICAGQSCAVGKLLFHFVQTATIMTGL